MRFLLVPYSATLDDHERRNSLNRSVISPNSAAYGTDYVKVVEDHGLRQYFLQRKPKNLVLAIYHSMAILVGDHPNESVKVRQRTKN